MATIRSPIIRSGLTTIGVRCSAASAKQRSSTVFCRSLNSMRFVATSRRVCLDCARVETCWWSYPHRSRSSPASWTCSAMKRRLGGCRGSTTHSEKHCARNGCRERSTHSIIEDPTCPKSATRAVGGTRTGRNRCGRCGDRSGDHGLLVYVAMGANATLQGEDECARCALELFLSLERSTWRPTAESPLHGPAAGTRTDLAPSG